MNLILYENDMYELQEIQYLKNCSSDRKKEIENYINQIQI